MLQIGAALSVKSSQPVSNWLSASDMRNLLDLAGWEVIHQESRVLLPCPLPLIGGLLNRFIAPLVPWLALVIFQTARLRKHEESRAASVSVIVPARNEAGNIDAIVQRVVEKLGPQLQELLSQNMKPLVENLIQNELAKKD